MLHLLVVSLIVSLSMVGHVGGLTMDAALSTGRYMYTVLIVIKYMDIINKYFPDTHTSITLIPIE